MARKRKSAGPDAQASKDPEGRRRGTLKKRNWRTKSHPIGQPLGDSFPDWWEPYFAACAVQGTHTAACAAVGIDYTTPYSTLHKHPDLKPEFDARRARAAEEHRDRVVTEMHRRAIQGYMEPVIYKGRIAMQTDPVSGEIRPVAVRRYSDRALELAMRYNFPEKFRAVDPGTRDPKSMPIPVINITPSVEGETKPNG